MKQFYDIAMWRYRLASMYLRAWIHKLRLSETRYIGITGSAGKTTTKDLCNLVLSEQGPVSSTVRSANTPLSIAETILDTRREHRFCVIEYGGFKPGALDLPLRLVRPDISVLTNIGTDHLSAFDSVEGIAREKAKLIDALPSSGTAVLNIDDPRVRTIGERRSGRVIWVGRDRNATIRLIKAESRWPEPLTLVIEHNGRRYRVDTQLHGTQLSLPVLSTLGVALAMEISMDRATSRLADATPSEGRMQVVTGDDGVVFIRDDWKAPYWTLNAPIEFLQSATASRKVIIIGTVSDMKGDSSGKYKRLAKECHGLADLVIFVGPNASRAVRGIRQEDRDSVLEFATVREAAGHLRTALAPGDLVLLKGSNIADHLVRIVMDRERPVQCWLERCGIPKFCGDCGRVYGDS